MQDTILFFVVLYLCQTGAYIIGQSFENDNQIYYTGYASERAATIRSKWCGHLDIPEIIENNINTCCQTHDICDGNDYILPNQEKHGLKNDMVSIASTCSCNRGFIKCLKAIGSYNALKVYNLYTNNVRKCFQFSKRIDQCKYYNYLQQCIKYDFRKDDFSRYQWFDHYLSMNNDDDGILGTGFDELSVTDDHSRRVVNQPQFPVYPPQRPQQPSQFTQQQPQFIQVEQPPLNWLTFNQPPRRTVVYQS